MVIERPHFISGLPRSGSTLLGAILRQNPAFHAGMSSPAGGLMNAIQAALGPNAEFADQVSNAQRHAVLRAAFTAFYAEVAPARTVFDTNRRWCARLSMLDALFPESKVIVCVRDLLWVMDSVERLVQRNGLARTRMFNPRQDVDVYARCDALMAHGGMVGSPWHAIHEAFYGPHASKLVFVDYESLASDPAATLDRIYDFLRIEPFAHDFTDVAYEGGEGFDAKLGVPGLHTVRKSVGFEERKTVLPPELHNRYVGRCFWRGPDAAAQGVAVVSPPPRGRRQVAGRNPGMST